MRKTPSVKPELVVVTDGIDHERVVLPPSNRVAEPRRIGLSRVLSTVYENLAVRMNISFLQDVDVSRFLVRVVLKETEWIHRGSRDAERKTPENWILSSIALAPLKYS